MPQKLYRVGFICIVGRFAFVSLYAQREYIVTVNPATGQFLKIDSIPGVTWFQSYSTYNYSTKEYTVMGTGQPGQSSLYLYTRYSESGQVSSTGNSHVAA